METKGSAGEWWAIYVLEKFPVMLACRLVDACWNKTGYIEVMLPIAGKVCFFPQYSMADACGKYNVIAFLAQGSSLKTHG